MNRFPAFARPLLILLESVVMGAAALAAGPYDREKVSLNGTWDFYPNNAAARYDIKVPAYWDETTTNGHPAAWSTLGYAVYKKSFAIPAGMAGKEIFLNIGALTVLGKVYFNGTRIGGETTGGYLMMMLPYNLDVTRYANIGGSNRLEVHVYARSAFPSDAMNGSRYLYPFGTDMYVGRRGICGDVSITAWPKVYISDVQVITDLNKNASPSDDTISLKVTVTNRTGSSQNVTIKNAASLVGGGTEKTFGDQSLTIEAGASQTIAISNVAWTNASYWWPTDPKLYRLTTSMVQDATVIDAVDNRFGFRQFYAKANSNFFELNGIRCNLRGDGVDNMNVNRRWGNANDASIGYACKVLDEWKAINLNVFRNHTTSLFNDEVFDHCDEIGMMVIDEPPYWQSYQQGLDAGTAALDYLGKYLLQWVKNRKNHPSIIMYAASNEEANSPATMPAKARSTIVSYDSSRPVYNEGSQNYSSDDEINYHYTSADGGWDPTDPIKRTDLYHFFSNVGTTRPRGEGEAMWACSDAQYPKLDATGKISGSRCELDGSTPDAVSYAVWARQAARALRGARYQGLADYRSFMNVYHAFEWCEGQIVPAWSDWSGPGLKPVVMTNRNYNPFDPCYPAVIHGDGYPYYQNSYAPVAAFDTACDAANTIGATPVVYTAGNILTRTLVLYNDEFSGGSSLTVDWVARYQDPGGAETDLASGTFNKSVSYGEKATQDISFTIPAGISGNKILNLGMVVRKNSIQRFQETNKLGYINGTPAAKLYVSNPVINLGRRRAQTGLLHKIKLINIGGGASETWTASGYANWLTLNWTTGNLRGEQEIFYTVNTTGMSATSAYTTTVTFTGSHGTSAQATITVPEAVGETAFWAAVPWTGDADSGIVSGGSYTMAVNVGGGGVTVNGVAFEASASAGANFATDGGGTVVSDDSNNSITGSSAVLGSSHIEGITPRTLTLTHLVVGATYELSLFSSGAEASGRTQTFAAEGTAAVFDQDFFGNNAGIRIYQTFTATASERTVTITQAPGGVGSFQLCAMANRLVTPKIITATGLVSNPSGYSVSGQTVQFAATVMEGATTATGASGTFNFRVDGTDTATEFVANGTATFSTNSLAPGTHTVQATYSGDATYAGSQTSVTHSNITPQLLTFDFGVPYGTATITGNQIAITLPAGTNVASLAPTYTYLGEATGSPVSGSARDFTSPVTYTLTSTVNPAVTSSYIVTVTVPPFVVYSTRADGKTMATFRGGSSTWTIPSWVNAVEVLVVGGGGGGGQQSSGGGAGGMYQTSSFAVTPGASVNVAVGAGGLGGNGPSSYVYYPGTHGGSSRFDVLIAYGGGRGGSYNDGGDQGGYSINGGAVIVPGNLGGHSAMTGHYAGGGGAGGAGAIGNGTNGGIGAQCAITGSSIYYAGGGAPNGNPALGGLGGGGDGAHSTAETSPAKAGADGFGGGGGGGWGDAAGGAGGSGIVIVAYPSATIPSAPIITGVTAGDGGLTVAFTPPGTNGGAAIFNYKYSTDNGGTFIPVSPATITGPIVINGLSNGTEYLVKLLAVNAVGDGPASAAVPATPHGNYASWALAHGLSGGPTAVDSTGIPNLLVYALGSNRWNGTLSGNLLSYSKRPEAVTNGDVQYAIEESSDLGLTDPWTEVEAYATNDATTISYALLPAKNKCFARLVVRLP